MSTELLHIGRMWAKDLCILRAFQKISSEEGLQGATELEAQRKQCQPLPRSNGLGVLPPHPLSDSPDTPHPALS